MHEMCKYVNVKARQGKAGPALPDLWWVESVVGDLTRVTCTKPRGGKIGVKSRGKLVIKMFFSPSRESRHVALLTTVWPQH